MKRMLFILYVLLGSGISALAANGVSSRQYSDSIWAIAKRMPATSVRLAYLADVAYRHQYPPYNLIFSNRLFEEALLQKSVHYENLGAYYLASCYDRKHSPDTLLYWVDRLKEYAPQVGTYDYYLEQKAAFSRALASKKQIEKAVHVAKVTLAEAKSHHSNNGMMAAYNSLGCAYSVSSRAGLALEVLLQAHKNFTPQTKTSLRVDILSRIAQVYGNNGQDSLKLPYLHEMDTTLQAVRIREPEARKNWTDFEIDCEVKYILHYMNSKQFGLAQEHINKAKKLLAPHVDPVYWLNTQLVQLQYYCRTHNYDKSIALIDEVTPNVLNNYVSTFSTLINYKANTQYKKGDVDGAIATLHYLIHKQDSLNNAFSSSQLRQMKDIYHIDELLAEKQKITDSYYERGFVFLTILLLLIVLFYFYTQYLSKKIAVSERLTSEAALQAEAENATKEHLKAEISHDVRIPLNSVVGFAELLTESTELDAEARKEYGKIIQLNAENLLNYINSILELSRLESGKTQYLQEECEVVQFCRQIVQKVNGNDGSPVTVTLQTDLESQLIRTDCKWFESVLTSLLLPVEHETGQPPVVVCLKKDADNPGLCLEVVNSPLAGTHFENRTSLIRHEINAHFVHHFGGIYKVQPDTDGSPAVISFTIPLTNLS